MIFNAIFSFFWDVIKALIALLPAMPKEPSWISSLSDIFGFIAPLNEILPVAPVLIVVGFLFSVFVLLHGLNLIRRVISLASGGGGS